VFWVLGDFGNIESQLFLKEPAQIWVFFSSPSGTNLTFGALWERKISDL
jgi:hypothetical protein